MHLSYVIADLHLGHANVCKFTRDEGEPLRPWDDVDEMNEALIANWNAVVRERIRCMFLETSLLTRNMYT